jgi:DNA invertase Pin-like site-specific DNA recombinase
VWKLDRWGRSVAHCVRSIQELVSLGIRFLSPTESIDTGADSPMSKFLMHLFAAFAEMERGIIRERVCAGYARRRPGERPWDAPGAFSGGTKPSELRKEGNSWRNVAETIGMPMSTVIDACRDRSENPPKARKR